jgi:hypothetical protein
MARIPPAERQRRMEIIERFLAEGGSWRAIGVALGMDEGRIKEWHKRQLNPDRRPEHRAIERGHTMRACMCCRADFVSSGFGNRLCGSCRVRSPSPYTPSPGGDVGRQRQARRSG